MLSRIFNISSKKIFRWYKNILSGFSENDVQEKLHRYDTEDRDLIDRSTKKSKKVFVPILKEENFGEDMAIDDKNIGGEGYTIISNKKTGKIAAMIMTRKAKIICNVLSQVPVKILYSVKTITKDLAEGYDWVSRTCFMNSIKIVDKFHVIKLALQALQDVRVRYRQKVLTQEREERENQKKLEKERRVKCKKDGRIYRFKQRRAATEKIRYKNGETIKELLARSRYLLFKFKTDWTVSQKERADILFYEFPEIETAHKLICSFRSFYNIKTGTSLSRVKAKESLDKWYIKAKKEDINEIQNFVSTVERHEGQIINYFDEGQTNAFAESLNAKIQRFVITNYGIRNRNFFHFRLMKFLS